MDRNSPDKNQYDNTSENCIKLNTDGIKNKNNEEH
jgi:hypothetical protein